MSTVPARHWSDLPPKAPRSDGRTCALCGETTAMLYDGDRCVHCLPKGPCTSCDGRGWLHDDVVVEQGEVSQVKRRTCLGCRGTREMGCHVDAEVEKQSAGGPYRLVLRSYRARRLVLGDRDRAGGPCGAWPAIQPTIERLEAAGFYVRGAS